MPDLAEVRATICSRHYTRSWPAGKTVFYSFEDAIVTFSIPANYNIARWFGVPAGRVWELTRLWAPDGHRPNLLTEAISFAVRRFSQLKVADVLVSYADPSAGHSGGVYKAASWVALGRCEEARAYRDAAGQIVARRKFHSGRKALRKAEIIGLGYSEIRVPGKFRFARGITRAGRKAIAKKEEQIDA